MAAPRVLHVTNAGGFGRLQRGGGERAVEELSTAFSESEGWTAGVLAPPAFLESAHIGERVHRLPVELGELSMRRVVNKAGAVQQALCAYQPTVIITHLLRGSLVGLPAARCASIGVISNLHNSLRDSVRHGDGGLGGYLNLAAFRSIGRLAQVHVAISPSNERDLLRHDRMPRAKVEMIPNWVSSAFTTFEPTAGRQPDGLPPTDGSTLLCVGRLERQKRQDVAIRALAQLPSDVRLVFVGEGSLRSELEELASLLGVGDRVVFLGQRSDIPELMAAADLVVVPSEFEGFGRVAIEALSVGTRVVVSDVAGLRDVLAGAPVGSFALLPVGNADVWARQLEFRLGLTASDSEIGEMRRFAENGYSFAASFDRYRRLVERVHAVR